MADTILTATRLRELLHYDPETGLLTCIVNRRGYPKEGSIAGCKNDDGYLRIVIDGVPYLGHRLAWLHMTGNFPQNGIDHISGERFDRELYT
jgi:hypothetical protein